jgi:predicted ATPase/class 3 adenylate cyclase
MSDPATMHLPAGTVTFLFTDIQGSTKLWERSEESMRLALARHDVLLHEIIAKHKGVVFKTIGDAFCAAFTTAPDALQAALESQLALAVEAWPVHTPILVRMALHTGAAELRNQDYFGQTLNRVARILSSGHGGQVLLSEVTQGLCLDSLPEQVLLQPLGPQRLKDLGRPESVFQLVHPGLISEFPALRSLAVLPNNLPEQLTSFIGREKELEQAKEALRKTRLLTFIGPGGSGKTRLSLQIAAQELETYADGAWLVELAAVTDPALVAQEIANVFGVRETSGASVLEALIEHLKFKNLLLILDNCEHLIEASAKVVGAILTRCAQVTILTSSREALGIGGELIFRVPSLTLPDPKIDQTPESLATFESVELFVARAQSHDAAFYVTPTNANAVANICHSLDGIPLALELAAARVSALSVEDISRRLDHRFALLRTGSRIALPRQQTLKALIDWSYDLLSESERALLSRLSVFSGGWSLEMAEQVCSGDPLEGFEIFDNLTSLADKSLIVAEPRAGGTRYRLLETMRQYALDRLKESGQTEEWQARHLAHFLQFAEEASPHLRDKDQQTWLDRLEAEHDNLRAALAFSTNSSKHSAKGFDTESGLRLCAAIWRFWYVRGHSTEGRAWCAAVLKPVPEGFVSKALATTLSCSGVLASIQGDYEAARQLHERSLTIRRALGDELGIAVSLNNLGSLAHDQGHYVRAGELHEESLMIRRKLGDQQGIAVSLNNLATVAHDQGDLDRARSMYEETLAIQRSLESPWGTAVALSNLGQVAFDQGDYETSRTYLVECLEIRRFLGDRLRLPDTLDSFAALAATTDPLRAAKLWGASDALKKETGSLWTTVERDRRDARILAAKASALENEFEAAWSEGASLSSEAAIDLALGQP